MIQALRRKRSFSLFTLVLIAVTVGTTVYLPLSAVLDYNDKFDQFILDREKRLVQYLKMSQALYRAGADQELSALLREIRQQHDISYFAIYKNEELIYTEPPNFALAAGHTFDQRAPKAGKDLIDDIRSERSEFLADDTLLTIGIDKRSSQIFWKVMSSYWRVILQDIITVIAMAAGAFWLHTRDLTRLRKEIARFGRVPVDMQNMTARSAEAEAIVAGLQGYAAAEKRLKETSDKLSSQVLPALKRELFSQQEPPYTFECSLVRTDINGFSQIFNSPYRDRFAKHINDFFVGLTEIVSRYDGLIYEFVGDEAIFYFKDLTEDDYAPDDQLGPSTSINRAVDAIRDIHLLARDINTRTQMEGHRFTVKSALAHGTLRFGPLVDGFSLSGGILIETVRILSTVTDKAESHLYFASRHTPYLREDMQTEKVGVFSLKGYSEDVTLVRWVSSTELNQHLANVTLSTHATSPFDFVAQHRSDFGLETIISRAAEARDSWTVGHHLSLVHALRSVQVYKAHHPLGATVLDWLNSLRNLAALNEEWDRVISSILMVFPSLVPKSALGERETRELESYLDSSDPRTVANVINVLTFYDMTPQARPMKTLLASEHNRVASNALIHEGARELSDEILDRLDKMIFGRGVDEGRRASGLYALGEIARILRSRDAIYYSTRLDLHRLILRIEPFTKDKNESVALQAARAIAKAEVSSGHLSVAS